MNHPRQRHRHLQTNMYNLLQPRDRSQKSTKTENAVGPQLKKMELIEKLNQLIDNIGNTKNIGKCVEDSVIIGLEKIQEEARLYDFKEIGKMVNLAIGKRILNLELERKRTEIENKIEKKREIEEYFRENRIKKMQYEQLALHKLEQHSFIVKPYGDGKGFIESTIFYQKVISCLTGKSYQEYLNECNYLETIKKINKIFFNNFSNSSSEQSRKQAINNPILKLTFVLFVLLFALCIAICFNSNYRTQIMYAIFCANLFAAVLLVGLAFWSFCHIKLANNQLQETVFNVKQYFQKLNQENRAKGKRYEWSCHHEFLYLQVKFRNAEEESEISIKSDKPLYSIKLTK